MNCFVVVDKVMMFKRSDTYAKIRYEEMQTNVIPNEKLSRLLGFTSCQINGIPNKSIGYAVIPEFLLTSVNQYEITAIK